MSRAIFLMLSLLVPAVAARSVYTVQAARRPPGSVAVRVVGHQWWWEFQYPELGIVRANELEDASLASGRDVFASTACVNCHVVRGVGANGASAPT
jgi:heme/copper-type cytochrome/quinol oxidase subunit 2